MSTIADRRLEEKDRRRGAILDAAEGEAARHGIDALLALAPQNSGMYSPMAWMIIGGLVSSTLLARLVTPVTYQRLPPAI